MSTHKLFKSAAFSSGAKILHRLIGLVSTLILARVLTPDDFALIALISITLHLFDTLSNAGSEQYIIQKESVSDISLNTAWTLNIILKTGLSLALVLLAAPIAYFFEKPDLTTAIQVAASILIINALQNPGLILLKRELQYRSIFMVSLLQKIISFIVVLTLAFLYKSFWAFVIADVVAAIVLTASSYLIHQHKPKLSLREVSLQWLFSKWLMAKAIVGYLRSQIDTVLVGKFFDGKQLGNYSLSRDIVMLPANNLLGPAIEPLLADFKDYKKQPTLLGSRVSKALSLVLMLAIPIATFILFYPQEIVFVLLGSQWEIAGKIIDEMTLLFLYFVVLLVLESALTALGRVKFIFYFDLLSLAILTVLLTSYLLVAANLEIFVLLRGVVGVLLTISIMYFLHRQINIELKTLFTNITTTILAAVLSIIVSLNLVNALELNDVNGELVRFLLGGFSFVVCFSLLCLVTMKLVPNLLPVSQDLKRLLRAKSE